MARHPIVPPIALAAILGLGSVLARPAPVPAAPADPVAVIAAVKGRVDIGSSHGGPLQRAVFGRALERGDRVTVAAGGAATLFFNDGNVIEVAEKSSLTVSGRVGGKPAAGPASGLPGEVYASVTRFVAGGSRETGLVAGSALRGTDQAPIQLAPRRTAVLTDKPSFAWRAVEGATRYRVSVSSADKGDLWTREVAGLSIGWPADAAGIAAGDYLWEIEAFADARSLRKESSVFSALEPAKAATIRGNLDRIRDTAGGSDSPAARYLAGSYLSGLGLYQDATEQFGALCRLSPSSPAPHEALGNVYTKVGLMELAAAEFKQALALTGEP
ncbi:MAG: hypothetical protein HY076_01010 [Candidatus Eisenbacteria bacterium]|uniref:Tetratricopeptide repeat protein n=1 Tax=Eiseniibacteriota bacterium TaxID=2212470 RepID=A0A9D6L8F7_UNCEI|nr:hypothetical protein [Candidatus Eisenbacteria bacterium]MBI3538840.1 hypothetical protein [Candidatus Eisenbacteria bacterium]